jgi:hypothetical protein
MQVANKEIEVFHLSEKDLKCFYHDIGTARTIVKSVIAALGESPRDPARVIRHLEQALVRLNQVVFRLDKALAEEKS